MRLFLIVFLICIPISIWANWKLEGNYGKTTYGNMWNWLRGKKKLSEKPLNERWNSNF